MQPLTRVRPGEVSSSVTTEMTATPKGSWRLDTDNGSMTPRSALDVLVDLNDKVTGGRVSEYQPVPLGFTPLDKTIGAGLRAGELLLIGGAQGTGQDDDGPPDGAQRRVGRAGQRPVHLLRA